MTTAQDMMNPSVVQLEREESVRKAAEIMATNKMGSVIITAASYPVGIVTETDIVRFVANGGNIDSACVEEIMSSPLFSTTPQDTFLHVASTMSVNRIKKMPVLERQKVVGIITQTDIVRHALREVEEVQKQFSEGKLSHSEFSIRSAELFSTVPRTKNTVKEWHMRCVSCGLQFLVEENAEGKIDASECPKCGGKITYDLSPPI